MISLSFIWIIDIDQNISFLNPVLDHNLLDRSRHSLVQVIQLLREFHISFLGFHCQHLLFGRQVLDLTSQLVVNNSPAHEFDDPFHQDGLELGSLWFGLVVLAESVRDLHHLVLVPGFAESVIIDL